RSATHQDGAQRGLSARRQGRAGGRARVNTLRVKFVVLLVVAIVSVVGLLTVVLFYLLGPPQRSERALEGTAQQVELVLGLIAEAPNAVTVKEEPAPEQLYERSTAGLRGVLTARGLDLPVTISRDGHDAPLIVSVPIENRGWLWMPTSGMPPPGPPWK